MTVMAEELPVLVVAGASGFVGRALGASLAQEGRFRLVGLSRSRRAPSEGYDEWRAVDLFSMLETERALEGASVAVYLVHSMMPNDALTQARFEDLDLLCADNFARAAAKAGVTQIVYLGGLVPQHGELSEHLESRVEVERVLAAHGVPVTTLRAGLIVGPGGSSFEILTNLVKRLPVMVCPAWTATRTQPIALDDAVAPLSFAIGRASCASRTYDIGGPDVLTYREMMELTAEALGKRRWLLAVPLFSPSLSTLWVTLFSGASRALVAPLVQSLRHEMVARDRELADAAGVEGIPFREVLARSIAEMRSAETKKQVDATPTAQKAREPRRPRRARSIQRLPLPGGRSARWVAANTSAGSKARCARFFGSISPRTAPTRGSRLRARASRSWSFASRPSGAPTIGRCSTSWAGCSRTTTDGVASSSARFAARRPCSPRCTTTSRACRSSSTAAPKRSRICG